MILLKIEVPVRELEGEVEFAVAVDQAGPLVVEECLGHFVEVLLQ